MDNQNILISVVMPVYNGELYLDDAIQGILNQTYKNFEFIIINDGSTDKSLEIINRYKELDDRIILISRENKGLIASLNEGIEKTKGLYIARMDADDISLPNRFEKQINLIEKENLDICGCHYFIINEENKYLSCRLTGIDADGILLRLAYSVPFAHGSVMIKKSLLRKFNYGETKYKSVEDYALWVSMYENNTVFGNVDEFLFKYREFNQSFSKTKISIMQKERKTISDIFIETHKINICKSIDKLFNKQLTEEEQVLIVMLSLNLRYKLIDIYKKVSKKTFLIGFYKYIRGK